MAFMGMVLGTIFVVIFLILVGISFTSFVIAIICKIIGRVKNIKGARIAGTVFIVIGIVFILPVIALIAYVWFNAAFWKVELPDGRTARILTSTAHRYKDAIDEYIDTEDGEALETVEHYLDTNENIVYWRDNNYESLLEWGLESGSYDLVKLAIDHGAVVDDPVRYDHMAYVHSTMEEYLSGLCTRSLTDDDLTILELLLEEDCETEFGNRNSSLYSNAFGLAVWAVLYNDDTVTDNEVRFVEILVENGFDRDNFLILAENAPSNYLFGPETHIDVLHDDNYYEVLELTGG